jgi:ADP-ribosyl-[dinitrogen reductase] hydrolase
MSGGAAAQTVHLVSFPGTMYRDQQNEHPRRSHMARRAAQTFMKTSLSDPIQIAVVRPTPQHGRIGITFCPGKKDNYSMSSGPWNRDLSVDVEAIKRWGAAVVVTLVEQHELETLQVTELGELVHSKGMDWLHLPIRDVSVPSASFESEWRRSGEFIRSLLRNQFDVVVHCRGGLGRAGSIAARLLVELGETSEKAIDVVRSVRPGAIETEEQEMRVLEA